MLLNEAYEIKTSKHYMSSILQLCTASAILAPLSRHIGQVTTNLRSTALRGRFEAHRFTYNRPVICITYMHVNEEISRTNNLRGGLTSHAAQTRLPSHLENLHLVVGGALGAGRCTERGESPCQPDQQARSRIIRNVQSDPPSLVLIRGVWRKVAQAGNEQTHGVASE